MTTHASKSLALFGQQTMRCVPSRRTRATTGTCSKRTRKARGSMQRWRILSHSSLRAPITVFVSPIPPIVQPCCGSSNPFPHHARSHFASGWPRSATSDWKRSSTQRPPSKEELAEKTATPGFRPPLLALVRASLLVPVARSSQAAHQPAAQEIVPFLSSAIVADHRTLKTAYDLEAMFWYNGMLPDMPHPRHWNAEDAAGRLSTGGDGGSRTPVQKS